MKEESRKILKDELTPSEQEPVQVELMMQETLSKEVGAAVKEVGAAVKKVEMPVAPMTVVFLKEEVIAADVKVRFFSF